MFGRYRKLERELKVLKQDLAEAKLNSRNRYRSFTSRIEARQERSQTMCVPIIREGEKLKSLRDGAALASQSLSW